MDGVGQGSVLAKRYRLDELVTSGADGSLWRALDETLARSVSVRVVASDHPFAADIVDAARRAALVDDPRLARVLDVGVSGRLTYIVTEHVGGTAFEAYLRRGHLPAETVRRIVGEAAQALDRAGARGLHHLRLGPASVMVLGDGTIKLVGTAVEAAVAGDEPDDAEAANRTDAVGLVSLLYAGLTGRWPGVSDGPLGPAPRVTGRAVRPSDLVSAVPADLDQLCSITLGATPAAGPRSPAEVAELLAPWASAAPLTAPQGLDLGPARPVPQVPATVNVTTVRPVIDVTDRAAPGRPGVGAGARPATPQGPGSGTAAALLTDREADVPTPPSAIPLVAAPPAPVVAPLVTPERSRPAPSAPPFSAAAGGRPPAGSVQPTTRPDGGSHPVPGARPTPQSGAQTAAQTGPYPYGASYPAGRPEFAREILGDGHPPVGVPRRPWDDADRPAPFLPPVPVARPPKSQGRLVIALIAALLLIGVILGITGVRGLIPRSTPHKTPVLSAQNGTSPTPEVTPPLAVTAPAQTGAVLSLERVSALDPQGDGQENGASAPNVTDGDTGTEWRSERYDTADFGGLGKKGVGLAIDLGSAQTVNQVVIESTGTGGAVELRTATAPTLAASTRVGAAKLTQPRLVLTLGAPTQTRYLVLWFTTLPQQGSGDFRLRVSEVSVR